MEQQQQMEELQRFFAQNWYYVIGFNLLIGTLAGLVPFFLARKRGKNTLGLIALTVSAVLGIPSCILGIISGAVFTIIIWAQGRRAG
jgi:hypothetical protein